MTLWAHVQLKHGVVRYRQDPASDIRAGIARPGRTAGRARTACGTPGSPDPAAVPGGSADRGFRSRLFLGCRTAVLADAGCLLDRGGLRRRLHSEPDV